MEKKLEVSERGVEPPTLVIRTKKEIEGRK